MGLTLSDSKRPSGQKESRRRVRRRHLHLERRRTLLIWAGITGFCAGLVAVAFQLALSLAESTSRSIVEHSKGAPLNLILIVVACALLGGISGHVTHRLSPAAAGSGIPHVKAVLMGLREFRPLRLILIKFSMGFTALAAGLSLGREGPTIQMGAAIGALVGKWAKLSRRGQKPLIAAGAGAGLAAAFNAPLAGFLFVMEEMRREMSALTYATALVGSVCAVAVKQLLLGPQASFHLPAFGFITARQLPLVMLVGLAGGLFGVVFNFTTLGSLNLRDRIKAPRWLFAGVIGAIGGILLVSFPIITGGGHGMAEGLLRGEFNRPHLLAFIAFALFGKLLFTSISYSAGTPGGIFAPILALGALLGYGLGLASQILVPGFAVEPAVLACVGMGAVLTGSVRAPLTGVVLVFEMTSEYRLLYPLLLAAFLANVVADLIHAKPVYESLLERDLHSGIVPPMEAGPNVLELLIEPDSEFDGKTIAKCGLPPGSLVALIDRDGRQIIPSGGTKLMEGDIVTVLVPSGDAAAAIDIHDAAKAH